MCIIIVDYTKIINAGCHNHQKYVACSSIWLWFHYEISMTTLIGKRIILLVCVVCTSLGVSHNFSFWTVFPTTVFLYVYKARYNCLISMHSNILLSYFIIKHNLLGKFDFGKSKLLYVLDNLMTSTDFYYCRILSYMILYKCAIF